MSNSTCSGFNNVNDLQLLGKKKSISTEHTVTSETFFKLLPEFHRAVVLPLETMLLSEFDRDCSFITGSAGGERNYI